MAAGRKVAGQGSCGDKKDADRGEAEAGPLYPAEPFAEYHPGQQHGDPGVERGQDDRKAEHAGSGGRYVADVRDDIDHACAGRRQQEPPAGTPRP